MKNSFTTQYRDTEKVRQWRDPDVISILNPQNIKLTVEWWQDQEWTYIFVSDNHFAWINLNWIKTKLAWISKDDVDSILWISDSFRSALKAWKLWDITKDAEVRAWMDEVLLTLWFSNSDSSGLWLFVQNMLWIKGIAYGRLFDKWNWWATFLLFLPNKDNLSITREVIANKVSELVMGGFVNW